MVLQEKKKKNTKALNEHQGETLNSAWRQGFKAVVLLVETKQEAIYINIYGNNKKVLFGSYKC